MGRGHHMWGATTRLLLAWRRLIAGACTDRVDQGLDVLRLGLVTCAGSPPGCNCCCTAPNAISVLQGARHMDAHQGCVPAALD